MNIIRNLEPSIKLVALLMVNLAGGMLFIVVFNYFCWGFQYDIWGAAIGLVMIGALLVLIVGIEICYVWRWKNITYSYRNIIVDYEPYGNCGDCAKKDEGYSKEAEYVIK